GPRGGVAKGDGQSGGRAGSAEPGRWWLGWPWYLVAPAASTRPSVASRSSTSRCICSGEAGSGQRGGYVARGGLKADVRAVRAGHHGPGRTRDGDLTAGDRGVERGQLPRLRAIERHPAALDRVT